MPKSSPSAHLVKSSPYTRKYKNSISKIIKYKDGYSKLIITIHSHLNRIDGKFNNIDGKINKMYKEIDDIDKEINRKTRSLQKFKKVLDPFATPSKNRIKYNNLHENLIKKKKLRNSLKQKLFITLQERDSLENHKKQLKNILEKFEKIENKIQQRFKVYTNKNSLNPKEIIFLESELNYINKEFQKNKNGVGKLDKWKNISIIAEKNNR